MKNKKRRSVQIFVSDQPDRPARPQKAAKSSQASKFAFAKPPIKINLWVIDAQRRVRRARSGAWLWLSGIVTILLLLGGGWLAARLIVNPGGWLRGVLPEWNQTLGLQTLAEIRAEAAQSGQTVGGPIGLAKGDVLLPILAPSAYCRDCLQIVELRAYQLSQKRFELIDRLAAPGVEELMAIAPLTHSRITSAGSSRRLPLTAISMLEGKSPDAGVWLVLSGNWQRSSTQTLYGQIIRYDPLRDRLQPLLTWTSPAAELPRWQQITGSATPELVVDQTIGLEPQFQVYQVQTPNAPGKPVQLEAITLTESVLDNSSYENGLLLARNGLWSDALKYFQQVKAAGSASARLQAQMALVSLHAQQTRHQADRTWASPTQQITALLIDGRWTQAFDRLKAARTEGYDIETLLIANADLFWQRITAALRVNPNQPNVQRWGALVKAAQHDRTTAMAWLKQTQSSLSTQQAQSLFALLNPPAADPPLLASPASPATPRLLGSATLLNRPNLAAWFAPRSPTPPANAAWYEIEVLGFQQGQQWQQPALVKASNAGELQLLWEQLGLNADTQLQLIAWSDGESQTISATIEAIQNQAGRLRLLASAAPTAQPMRSAALALTPNSLRWLSPINTLTLATLKQQQPAQTAALIKTLEAELEKVGQGLPVATAVSDASSPNLNQWSIDQMELTGDAQAETVLTLNTDKPKAAAPRTLIFSAEGGLLYSDLQATGQALVGIVDLGSADNTRPALVLRSRQGYRIQQWSGSEFR